MIRNKIEIISEQEIYEDINVLIKSYGKDKYFYIDGMHIKTLRDLKKSLGFENASKDFRYVHQAMRNDLSDALSFSVNEKRIVIIIKNFQEMVNNLAYMEVDKEKLIDVFSSICYDFECGQTAFTGGYRARKSIDFYLSDDDIDFEKLEGIITNRYGVGLEWIEDRSNSFIGGIHPIGTVVKLKEDFDSNYYSYVITDRFVLENKESKEYYEYKASLYPMGTHPSGKSILFNNEQIDIVEYVGYETAQDKKFVKDALKQLKEKEFTKKEDKKSEQISKNKFESSKRPGSGVKAITGKLYREESSDGETVLPTKDANGNSIIYKKYDVNEPGKNGRDGEKFVGGSDGSEYYTATHYGEGGDPAFIKIEK